MQMPFGTDAGPKNISRMDFQSSVEEQRTFFVQIITCLTTAEHQTRTPLTREICAARPGLLTRPALFSAVPAAWNIPTCKLGVTAEIARRSCKGKRAFFPRLASDGNVISELHE